MIKLDEQLQMIHNLQINLTHCKKGSPHYLDLVRRIRKLRNERSEALEYLKASKRNN